MLRIIYLTIVVLTCNFAAIAQENSFIFKKLSSSDGLSQSSVITIHQDKSGQMWLGTRDGLNKYDGNKFTVYKNNPADSLSISNDDILSIEEDKDGFLWIGTYNGLNRYNPITNEFKTFFHSNKKGCLSNNTIWGIEEIGDVEVWMATTNGLSIYNKKTEEFLNFFHSPKDTLSLPDNHVLSILQKTNGDIYIGTAKGLARVEAKGESYNFKTVKDNLYIQDLIEDDNSNLWVATKNKGLYKLKEGSEHLKSFRASPGNKIDNDIRALTIDKKGRMWLGTYDGLNIINPDGKIEKILNNPYKKTSLSKNTIKSLYTDKKGSVWIGTYYGGVNIWDDANSNFTTYNQDGSKNQLSYDVISSIEKDKTGNLYFGTEGGGITVLRKDGKAEYINTANNKNLPSDNIKSLLISDQRMWIGSFNRGLAVYDLASQRFVNGIISDSLKELIDNVGVYTIKNANDTVFWFGTFGKGVIKYNTSNSSFETFTSESGENSLTSNQVRKILIDSKNSVWVATESGLNKIVSHGKKGKSTVKHFFYNDKANSGEDILTLFEDKEGQIWVGSKSNGLFLYEDNDFLPRVLKVNSDILATPIHSMLEDDNQNLWISTNRGIVKYNPKAKSTELYNQDEGLTSNEFNNNAALELSNQRFYFGGPSGVSSFNPQNIIDNDYSPQVILTDFNIKGKSVNDKAKKEILDKNITYVKSIQLDYDEANFSIQFAIPNYINSSSNHYAYRLLGLEKDWNTTFNNEVSYTIQDPGDYTFQVKGANNDNVWNSSPTELKIEVAPAPWRSWWAFVIYAILIGAALYGLIWIMKSKTKLRHKLELEQLEKERNSITNTAKLQFFTNISHEFRTPLTLILGPLQQLLLDYKGSNKMYKKLLTIESNANHLLQLINRLMDFRKLENDQYKIEAAEGNIVKFIKEIYLSFKEFARIGGYNYTFQTSDEEILVYYDRRKLERVFYNLISNAFKYTPKGGDITIQIIKGTQGIIITVEDSGVGIVKENLEKVFDRFYEIERDLKLDDPLRQGTGIGLSIAKNIVKLHKGRIEVKSEGVNKGSTFQVELPLGRQHLSDNEIIKDFHFSDDLSLYTKQLKKEEVVLNRSFEDMIFDKKKPTILIVEDNMPLRSFIINLLKDDYNILDAENGKVAMQKALKYIPDLVISDVIMPEMVGTELCAEIKKNLKTSHVPVILLTSRSSLIYKFEGLESGADDYISKPFNIKEFVLRVKNLLETTQKLRNKFSDESGLSPSELTVSSMDEKLMEKALSIVENNIDNEQFNIPLFSEELGVSRTMLFTKIKAWTNFTPNEFITEIRMKRAAQLLEQDKLNISQVSYRVGFKNPKYFTKCFQKKFGLTPSQYSKKFYEDIEIS